MNKKITRAWSNGKEKFLSVYGVKGEYARELLYMGDIKNPKLLKNRKSYWDISPRQASKILENIGYKWIKINLRKDRL